MAPGTRRRAGTRTGQAWGRVGQTGSVPPRRRISPALGRRAVAAWAAAEASGCADDLAKGQAFASPDDVATAVRFTLEELSVRAPGHTLEIRVPPFGVTQCLPGPRHTRGTPPNVIETDPGTWLALVVGRLSWDEAQFSGRVRASGARANLADWLPLELGDSGERDRLPG